MDSENQISMCGQTAERVGGRDVSHCQEQPIPDSCQSNQQLSLMIAWIIA